MGMYTPNWSIQEYEEFEPKRLSADQLETNQFYFLGLPNRGGSPDAYRALVQVENLRWQLGNLALGVRYYTRDFIPDPKGPQPSIMHNNYWIPDRTLKLSHASRGEVRVDKGYFLPYDDPLDDEILQMTSSLEIPLMNN